MHASARLTQGMLATIGFRSGDQREVRSASLALAALTWLPLGAIALFERMTGRLEPLLRDFSVHTRLLIAVPLLPVAMTLIETRCAEALSRLVEEEYAPDPSVIARLSKKAERWSHSPITFAVTLALAVGLSQSVYWGLLPTTGVVAGEKLTHAPHGAASIWYT